MGDTGGVDDQREAGPDPDSDARKDALQFMARRTAIWALPLALVALLMTGLGIPLWISVIAMLAVLAVLVFEIDL